MPTIRSFVLANNEVYHVFNRSVASEEIFQGNRNISRAFELIKYYKNCSKIRFSFFKDLSDEAKELCLNESSKKPLVDIFAYALMPNHFHLLVRQLSDKGVEKFLANFQNGFAKFYNIKFKRNGALFQRPFKAKHIATDSELLHVSRYIHLNPVTSYSMNIDKLKTSNITSLPFYLNISPQSEINTSLLTKLVGSTDKYLKFVENQVDYQRRLAKIRHLLIEK